MREDAAVSVRNAYAGALTTNVTSAESQSCSAAQED